MVSLTPEAIDYRAAEKLGEIHKVLHDFEFADCVKYVAARDYDAVMVFLKNKLDQETRSFASDVMTYDNYSWSSFLFRRRVHRARKRYEAVSNAYGSWGVFMTRVRHNAWD